MENVKKYQKFSQYNLAIFTIMILQHENIGVFSNILDLNQQEQNLDQQDKIIGKTSKYSDFGKIGIKCQIIFFYLQKY